MKVVVIGLALVACTSCVTYERCTEKFGQQSRDSVAVPFEKLVPIKVVVPPDSASLAIMLDSLMRIREGVIYTAPNNDSSAIQIQYWIDKYRRLQIKALKPPQVIHDTIPLRDTIRVPPPPILVDKPSKLQRFWDQYCDIAGILLPFVIVLIIVLRR